jgi:hypothetical protein
MSSQLLQSRDQGGKNAVLQKMRHAGYKTRDTV